MKTERIQCELKCYLLASIKVIVVRYNNIRIEYTLFNNEDDYFLHYKGDEDVFSLEKETMIDITQFDIAENNGDQWFQLLCALDLDIDLDLYYLHAIQKYCKEVASTDISKMAQDTYYDVEIDIISH